MIPLRVCWLLANIQFSNLRIPGNQHKNLKHGNFLSFQNFLWYWQAFMRNHGGGNKRQHIPIRALTRCWEKGFLPETYRIVLISFMPGEEKFFIAMMVEAYQMKKGKKKRRIYLRVLLKLKKKKKPIKNLYFMTACE